tara:strand:+ start:248 stop:466 length:219 start_codon:yes stop_codon:yes gene_type:complete
MEDNSLLMIILAFILGYMFSGMMKQMCGQQLVEGLDWLVVKGLKGQACGSEDDEGGVNCGDTWNTCEGGVCR